jgi:formylglycine-generating enzyme required for sulfatase activity
LVGLLLAVGLTGCQRDAATIVAPAGDGPAPVRSDPFLGSKGGDEREVAGVKLCWCPPGRFRMGSPPDEPERRPDEAQVEVTLTKGFWMGKYGVTQGQWKRVVGKLPGELTAAGGEGDELPVYNVNYAEAEAFCLKLTHLGRQSRDLPTGWAFRLPTEAQREYACRAGTKTATAFGDKLSSKQANFQGRPYNGADKGPSLKRATKVGSYAANAWGLHDMHANVCEWCRDWYHPKLPGGDDPDLSSIKGPMNRDGTFSRVRRGGAWCDDGWACRSAFRQRFEPERRYDHIGFRVAVVVTNAGAHAVRDASERSGSTKPPRQAAPARDGANFTRDSAAARKFGVHEITLTGNGSVANPFDTAATVTFTPPSGKGHAVTVKAFYDGRDTWRARVYVSEVGRWRWRSKSATDPGLNGKAGSFTAVNSTLRGLLHKHRANPRALQSDDGRWFLCISDTCWKLFHPTEGALWRQYVRDDVRKGVTVLGPAGMLGGYDGQNESDWRRSDPWVGGKDGYDFTRYDLAKFQNTERRLIWIFDHYPDLYVQALLSARYWQSAWAGWPRSVRTNTIDYLIARWSAFPNLFWLAGEDQDTKQPSTLAFNREFGGYFAAHEPWKHLMSTEPNRFQGFPFTTAGDRKWVSYLLLEDSDAPGAKHVRQYRLEAISLHVMLGEDYYEQDYGPAPSGKANPRFYCRWAMWSWILSGGSCNYGGRYGVLHPYSQTARADLHWTGPGGADYTGHPLKGLDSVPYIGPYFSGRHIDLAFFRPHDDRVRDLDGRTGKRRPKLMERGRDEFLVYHPNAATDGNAARVDQAKAARLRIDLTAAPGTFEVEWYRPLDGVARGGGTLAGGAARELTAPWRGCDVVLRLVKK